MSTLSKPIICCGFTPCVQRIIEFKKIEKGGVNRAQKVTIGIGGKGANVARMVTQLGGSAELIEFVGGPNGQQLEALLNQEGVGYRHVQVDGETRICQTLLEAGNPDATELVEEMPPVSSNDWKRMLELFQSLEIEGALIAVSGKLPAGAPADGYAAICELAHRRNARVIIDTQGEPLALALKHRPFLVKINEAELREATGCADLFDGCARLMELGAESVFITRGSRSSFYVDAFQRLEVSSVNIDAVNPIGSGDAVTTGIAVALNAGQAIEEALKTGMACGAANALNLLSGYLKPEDVERLKGAVALKPVGE